MEPFPAYLNDKRICESDEYVAAMQRAGIVPGRRYNEVLIQQDKGLAGPVKWSSPACADSDWETAPMYDNRWARNGYRPLNGVFWLRRYVDIPAGLENDSSTLYLGRIEGADSTFINGQYVGSTSYQYPPRIYPVKPGVLKAGRNLVAVRMSGFGVSFVKGKPYKFAFANKQEVNVEGDWKYKVGVILPMPAGGGVSFPNKPVGLYNGMIAPLKHHALKGVIWYQGESNADRYNEYYALLTSLIRDWRSLWGQELPFLVVQLPNYMEPGLLQPFSSWAELRNVQLKVTQDVPRTALAVAIDLGEWNDIHPVNKKDVGKRLALQARKLAYGEKIISEGPSYQSMEVVGNKVWRTFKEGTGNLMPVDSLEGFTIAGADGVYKLAKATIEGKKVVAWSNEVPEPRHLRYAWANNPEGANLRNEAGLPASPFRTE